MRTPIVGKPVRGSRTGRPIMVVLDVLGRRTVLRILWELQAGPMSFRTLQEACATNSAHLNARLRELRDLDLVELVDGGYQLTAEGWKLREALMPLAAWARRWGRSAAARAAMTPESE
jgi:DNA-binding HxlR family transcriptional regulator